MEFIAGIVLDETIKAKIEQSEWKKLIARTITYEKQMMPLLQDYFKSQEKAVISALNKYSKAITFPFLEKEFIYNQADELSEIIFPIIKQVVTKEAKLGMSALQKKVRNSLKDFNLDSIVLKAIQKQVATAASEITQTTFKRLLVQYDTGIELGEDLATIKDRIATVFTDAVKNRVATIARTEVLKASNEGRLSAYQQSGVVNKVRWYTAVDERRCSSCAALHDKVVKLNSEFIKGITAPPLHPNCFIDGQIPIYTVEGWKPIKDIKVGDLVLTHKGRFRKVTQLIRTLSEQPPSMVDVQLTNGRHRHTTLTATEDHPILLNGKWLPIKDAHKGMQVIRFSGSQINSKLNRVEAQLTRLISNHDGLYSFMNAEIVKVRKWKCKTRKQLFNFSVEEDESYIAKGFVVHNCRCILLPEVDPQYLKSWLNVYKDIVQKMGTASSGNHGHGGRPGKRGGSISVGGSKSDKLNSAITQATKEYTDQGISPKEITHGHCYEWAQSVKTKCPEVVAKDIAYGKFMFGVKDLPYHVWVEHKGKAYDAESPKGVKDWKELNYFKFHINQDIIGKLKSRVMPTIKSIGDVMADKIGLAAIFKMGMPSSGNHGHAGRPGKVGGSTLTGGKVFHGTTARILKKIIKEGIIPQGKHRNIHSAHSGRKDYVFVAKDFKKALAFADKSVKGKASLPVVFKVRANPNTLQNDNWTPGAKMKKGGFPPEDIISFTIDRGKHWYAPQDAFKGITETYYVGFAIEVNEEKGGSMTKQIGLSLLFKMGTASSGNHGHGGRPGKVGGSVPAGGRGAGKAEGKPKRETRKGMRAGLTISDAQRAKNKVADAKKAKELGLTPTKRGADGKLTLLDGSPLPKHLTSGLARGGIPPGLEDVYVNLNARAVANGAYAVRGRSSSTGEIVGKYAKDATDVNMDKKWLKTAKLEKAEPAIEKKILKDMKSTEWLDVQENSACMRLIQVTAIRAGDENDTKFGVYGACTLQGRHAKVSGNTVTLDYIAKESVHTVVKVTDPFVVKDIKERLSRVKPNENLFETNYHGKLGLLNYCKSLHADEYTPKNFRTLRATQWAVEKIKTMKSPTSKAEYVNAIKEVCTHVGAKLGHVSAKGASWTTAKDNYVNPYVFSEWNKGGW